MKAKVLDMDESYNKTLDAGSVKACTCEREANDEAFDETETAKNEVEKKHDTNTKDFPFPSYCERFLLLGGRCENFIC